MKIITQLSLFLENKPGALEQVAASLAWANINIEAMTVSDGVDHAVIRMIVDDHKKALHLLGEAGLLVIENEVIKLESVNQPGELHNIATQLAVAAVNIHYMYGSAGSPEQPGTLILRVDKLDKALEALSA